jgi:hypothetical protein
METTEYDGDVEKSLADDTLPLFESDDYEIKDAVLLAELEALQEKMNAIEHWYNTDGSVGGLSQIMDVDV